jgi:hypothetical protein
MDKQSLLIKKASLLATGSMKKKSNPMGQRTCFKAYTIVGDDP